MLADARCIDTSQHVILFSFDTATLKINSAQGLSSIQCDTLSVQGLQSFASYSPENFQQIGPFTLQLGALKADTISITNFSDITLGTVEAYVLEMYVVREQNGSIRFLDQLSNITKRKDRPEEKKRPVQLVLDHLTINNQSRARFLDLSTSPNVDLSATDILFTINNFSSTKKIPGQYSLQTTIQPIGNLKMNGTAASLQPQVFTTIHADLNQFSLPQISPYFKALFGYRVASGRLNATINGRIRSSNLNLNSNVTVRELTLTDVDTASNEFRDLLYGIPLKTAISILTDNQGDVKLDIPISGNISGPDFSYGDVIQTAVINGIQGGLKSILGAIGDIFTEDKNLTFKPVVFQAGSDKLSQENEKYLNTVAETLREHPNTRVELCGKATIEDLQTERQPAPNNLTSNQKKRLLEIANTRSKNVRSYLMRKKIASSKLFLCAPQIDDSQNAAPRVDMKIGA